MIKVYEVTKSLFFKTLRQQDNATQQGAWINLVLMQKKSFPLKEKFLSSRGRQNTMRRLYNKSWKIPAPSRKSFRRLVINETQRGATLHFFANMPVLELHEL